MMTLVNGTPQLPAREWSLVDVMCVNETEAQVMTNIRTDTIEGCYAASKKTIEMGCGMIVLTIGERGSLFVDTTVGLDLLAGSILMFFTLCPRVLVILSWEPGFLSGSLPETLMD